MPFTVADLIIRMNHRSLDTWSATTVRNQTAAQIAEFLTHFDTLMAWIVANGGGADFGTRGDVTGLFRGGEQVATLRDHGQVGGFNDAFRDVRYNRTRTFWLFKAADGSKACLRVMHDQMR